VPRPARAAGPGARGSDRPGAGSPAVPSARAGLVAALPDLGNAAVIAYLATTPERVEPAWRDLTFAFMYLDPALQFGVAMTLAVIMHLRQWPGWRLALLAAGGAAIGIGPLLYRAVSAFPAGHAGQALLGCAWMAAGRGWTWRLFPRELDTESDQALFRVLIRPVMQSLLAFGVAFTLVIVATVATRGHPDELPVDGLLAMVAIYFLARGLLVLPAPQRWLLQRL
jgi:hypothetical protein